MSTNQVRIKPGRSQKGPNLWLLNKANLKQHIIHPEWGLWKSHSLSKKSQTLLSAPREYRNNLIQKSYRLQFKNSFWHTFGVYRYCAILSLDEIRCYEVR